MHRDSTPFVKIKLTQGKVALVSPEDAERVRTLKWCATKVNNRFYAIGYVKGIGTKSLKLILMHRFIANTPKGTETDHINTCGLDNRRGNLRHATRNQNLANSRSRSSKSGFRGVRKMGRGWSAEITNGNHGVRYLGTFDSPEEAAQVWDAAARLQHGEFCRLNFPNEGERGRG